MKIPGRCNGPCVLQQRQRRGLAGLAGLDHRFVFGGIFVWTEQNFVQLLPNRVWANACNQFGRPRFDLRLKLLFLFNGNQRLLHDFGWRFAVAAFATTTKIMRRLMQAQQCCHLLHGAGPVTEIVFGKIGKAEFFIRSEFVGQLQLNALTQSCGFAQQAGRGWFFKLEQHGCSFDFNPFARVEFHLSRGLSLRQDASGHEFAGFFK